MIEGCEKKIVVSNQELNNVNFAMVMSLECKNRLVGATYVIEDGRVTEIHEKKKVIKSDKNRSKELCSICSICGSIKCLVCENGSRFIPK